MTRRPTARVRIGRAAAITALTLGALLFAACADDGVGDGAGALPASGYLALGDSLTVGIGASDPAASGYVARVHERLRLPEGGGAPPLVNLGISGETTTSMLEGTQLVDALAALGDEGATIDVVTVSIGGNDGATLFQPCAGGATPECREATEAMLERFTANFEHIVGSLVDAAGDGARVVVLAYYNPLVHSECRLHELAHLGDAVLEGDAELGIEVGLNERIREVAEGRGALVAETFGVLDEEHLQPDCLHPNDAGYAILAERIAEALEG